MTASSATFRIAVIGAGPAGFYTAEALLRASPEIAVDVYDKLPTPFGLVRYGVAPDHPKLKEVAHTFSRIARMPGFSFWGNVEVGADLDLLDLRAAYHAVVIATGAQADRKLQLEGSDLDGVHSATEFVSWYNGHPEFADWDFDLSGETAVVVGQGNVALDVARMLAKPAHTLSRTDVSGPAFDAIARSKVRRIYVVGRGAPERAACTAKELREFLAIPDLTSITLPEELNHTSQDSPVGAIFTLMKERKVTKRKRCYFRFYLKPRWIRRSEEGLEVAFRRGWPAPNGSDDRLTRLNASLVISSIGRRSVPIEAAPFDPLTGTIPNVEGQVLRGRRIERGLFVTGWAKRGPLGTIGSNRADAMETAAHVVAQLPELPVPPNGPDRLRRRVLCAGKQIVDFPQWERLDEEERRRGLPLGKPREKVTDTREMLRICARRGGEPVRAR